MLTSLDAATFLLQWATGGLAFLWVTTRRREVGLGYGWLMRSTCGLMALGALYVGLVVIDTVPVRGGLRRGGAGIRRGHRPCRSCAAWGGAWRARRRWPTPVPASPP
ncbi:MAG: hypothetical protein R2699_03725 [Acidimicrobiales bacterium]